MGVGGGEATPFDKAGVATPRRQREKETGADLCLVLQAPEAPRQSAVFPRRRRRVTEFFFFTLLPGFACLFFALLLWLRISMAKVGHYGDSISIGHAFGHAFHPRKNPVKKNKQTDVKTRLRANSYLECNEKLGNRNQFKVWSVRMKLG